MDQWKALERWESDRLKQPIGLARWGHYGVPVLVFPTAGGDAEEIERHQLLGHLEPFIEEGRIKVYSCDSVAGRVMTARDGSVRIPLLVVQPVPAGDRPRGGAGHPRGLRAAGGDRRGRVDRGVQLSRADLPLAAPVPVGDLHERHLRHRKVHRRIHPGSVLLLPAALPARAGAARTWIASASGSSTCRRDRVTGRTSASPGGRPRFSAPRVCPTGSTTGARSSITTGPPGGRCFPRTSSKPCKSPAAAVGAVRSTAAGEPLRVPGGGRQRGCSRCRRARPRCPL